LLILQSWRTFALPARDVEARARITLAANLAAEALCYDLGGFQVRLEEDPNRGPVYRHYKFVQTITSDQDHPDALGLLFQREDQATNPDQIIIRYAFDPVAHALVRKETRAIAGATVETQATVATNVTGFQVIELGASPPAPSLQVQYSVAYPVPTTDRPDLRKRFEGTYTLNLITPP
jgi:hypothetical protein